MRPKVTSSVRRIPKLHTSDLMENLRVGDMIMVIKTLVIMVAWMAAITKMLTMKMTMMTKMKIERTTSASLTCCSWRPPVPST